MNKNMKGMRRQVKMRPRNHQETRTEKKEGSDAGFQRMWFVFLDYKIEVELSLGSFPVIDTQTGW